MKYKTKASVDVCGIGGGIAGMACKDTLPAFDSITVVGDRQGICALLLQGETNALTAAELARLAGQTPRDVTRSIQRARLAGKPICASGAGYFLASDAAELARCVRGLDRRLREIRRTREALGDILQEMTGQLHIDRVARKG